MRIGRMLAAVALVATAFTACGEDDDSVPNAQPSSTLGATTTQAPSPIVVKDFSFSGLEVKAGSRVLVQNQGPATHTFTSEDNSFDTGNIAAGSNAQITVPSRPGTYKVSAPSIRPV